MSKFTALILAAGFGSRIADLTDDPKSLLKINNRTLMQWHFDSLLAIGITDVVVVTGHKREVLEDFLDRFKGPFNLSYVLNDDHRIKGNTYSLLRGLEKIDDDFLLFDADLVYETQILRSIVDDPVENQIVVGLGSIDDIESSKAMVDQHGFVRMIIDKRSVTQEERKMLTFAGEAIGIIKFSRDYKDKIQSVCEKFLAVPDNVSKNWEHVMNQFLQNNDMSVHQTFSNRWIEIDDKEDYERAKQLFL